MDGKTILSFMYKYELYFRLIAMSSKHIQALLEVSYRDGHIHGLSHSSIYLI